MNVDRIRKATSRAQHAGYTLTPAEVEALYATERRANPRQLGASPLDRRIVTRPVLAKGHGPVARSLERVQLAVDRAESAALGVKPEAIDVLAKSGKGTANRRVTAFPPST
jgi:hypothetical protein